MREGSVPFHSVPTPSLDIIWVNASVRGRTEEGHAKSNQKYKLSSVSHTKYACIVGLMKVFISELGPLELQSSVDHPHGSSEDHVHGPFMDNAWLTDSFLRDPHRVIPHTNLIQSQWADLCWVWTHLDQISSAFSVCWRCRSTQSWSNKGWRWRATSLCTETDWKIWVNRVNVYWRHGCIFVSKTILTGLLPLLSQPEWRV